MYRLHKKTILTSAFIISSTNILHYCSCRRWWILFLQLLWTENNATYRAYIYYVPSFAFQVNISYLLLKPLSRYENTACQTLIDRAALQIRSQRFFLSLTTGVCHQRRVIQEKMNERAGRASLLWLMGIGYLSELLNVACFFEILYLWVKLWHNPRTGHYCQYDLHIGWPVVCPQSTDLMF